MPQNSANTLSLISDEQPLHGTGEQDVVQYIDIRGNEGVEVFRHAIPIRSAMGDAIRLKTVVNTTPATSIQAAPTAGYFRQVRKQHFSTLQMLMRQVSGLRPEAGIQAYTAEVVDEINFAIETLDQSAIARRFEGNSTEILRMLRDTFSNTGWMKYSAAHTARQVVEAIDECAFDDSIGPDAVAQFRRHLKSAGLVTCSALSELKEYMHSDESEDLRGLIL